MTTFECFQLLDQGHVALHYKLQGDEKCLSSASFILPVLPLSSNAQQCVQVSVISCKHFFPTELVPLFNLGSLAVTGALPFDDKRQEHGEDARPPAPSQEGTHRSKSCTFDLRPAFLPKGNRDPTPAPGPWNLEGHTHTRFLRTDGRCQLSQELSRPKRWEVNYREGLGRGAAAERPSQASVTGNTKPSVLTRARSARPQSSAGLWHVVSTRCGKSTTARCLAAARQHRRSCTHR